MTGTDLPLIDRLHTFKRPAFICLAAAVLWACGSDGSGNAAKGDSGTGGASDGAGGASDDAGGSDAGHGKGAHGGSGGSTNAAGGRKSGAGGSTTSSGGATSSGGGGAHGGATGQPVGAICVNDSNCSQSGGMAVCCAIPGCSGPCECRLTPQCPKGNLFLECMTAKDCTAYGGGKVCCEAGSGASTMRYCTKPSGCTGTVLP